MFAFSAPFATPVRIGTRALNLSSRRSRWRIPLNGNKASARTLTIEMSDETKVAAEVPTVDALLEQISPVEYVNGPYVMSPTSEWESLRLFGQTEFDIRVVLYRDRAGWCPYCHKVQLLLEAKKIPYVVKKENMNCYGTKSADFLKKNPPGLLPVILLDGELVTEHVRIMFLLEETFQAPYTKLIPTEENDKMQAFHRFMRLERVLTGAWLTVLRTPVQLLSVAKPQLTNALTLVEESLAEFSGPFFLGQEPSFVDIMFSSILERTKATIKYFRNWDVSEGHPNLTTWYAAMKSWESARFISADEYSSALSIPPQIGSVTFMRERNDISLGVDARRSLYMLNDGPESQEPREEAAERLCSNLTAVVQDARKGARLDERLGPLLSTVLRIVASALIHPDKLEESEQNMKEVVVGEDVRRIVSALMFIRQRCCCPRDMTVDALEQFCGALNCFIRLLEPDAS